VRDDKRRGRTAAPAVIEASSRVQGSVARDRGARGQDRDPGQEAIHAVDVAFPADALTAKKLTKTPPRDRLPSPLLTGKRCFSFAVSIGSQYGER
jgi:hypothetical protein